MDIMLDKPEQIAMARLLTLHKGLKMEMIGLRLTGKAPTCYSIVKKEFGFKGNKAKVLQQLEDYLEEIGYDMA
jgi:hypothetical protein